MAGSENPIVDPRLFLVSNAHENFYANLTYYAWLHHRDSFFWKKKKRKEKGALACRLTQGLMMIKRTHWKCEVIK